MRASTILFTLSTLAQLGGCIFCTVWPIYVVEITPTRAWKKYTLADSNIDIFIATTINAIVLIIALCLARAAKPRRGSSFRYGRSTHDRMAKTVSFLSVIFQLLLLSKAVYVAIKGSDHVFPTSKKSGLAYIYASLVTALLTSFIQSATAQAMITRWKRQAALLDLKMTSHHHC